MSLRNEWEFDYSAKELLTASHEKVRFHEERLSWWETQKAAKMEEIRSSGLEVDEGIGAMISNTYRGATVTIDMSLQRDLTECVEKTKEHREKLKIYDAWCQTFEANPNARLKLHHDDWIFFFGK